MKFEQLAAHRWRDVQDRLALPNGWASLTWEVKDGYPHFKKPRGYAVCFHLGDRTCHLQFSPKIRKAHDHRVDGLLRHELGHVVDFIIPAPILDDWAWRQGVSLPSTPERRADFIAYLIWGEPIRYDADLVQSTVDGKILRPAHLGL